MVSIKRPGMNFSPKVYITRPGLSSQVFNPESLKRPGLMIETIE